MRALILLVILFSAQMYSTHSFAESVNPICDEGQSATAKTCGRMDYDGNCIYFNETTYTGRYCGEANVCGRNNYDGGCIFFNVTAACGEHSCTKSKTCGRTDYDGKCVYFNESISCR